MVGQNLGYGISCQGEGGSCAFRASRVKNALLEPATQKSHEDVIERVWSGGVGRAIVPVMNLKGGVLTDVIRQIPASDLSIVSEIYLKIDHHLLMPREVIFGRGAEIYGKPIAQATVAEIDLAIKEGLLSLDDHRQRALTAQITHVYADSQAFKQCDRGLRNIIPRAQLAYTNCTSDAALEVHKIAEVAALKKSETMPIVGAIASIDCAEMYNLYPVKRNIQDLGDTNLTRYLVLAQRPKNPTVASLKELIHDLDYEQIRRVFEPDVMADLFETVKFPRSVLADILDVFDKTEQLNIYQLLPDPGPDEEDVWTLDDLHTGWLRETVGDREIRDEVTGQVLFSAFQEARKNPYERVKLLREAMCLKSFMSNGAFESWILHSHPMIERPFKKLRSKINASQSLMKQKVPARRMADLIRKDYGHQLISAMLVRSTKSKTQQHQLLKPFFDNEVNVRVIDILPEVTSDGPDSDKSKTGHWMILEVDGYLGDYKSNVRKHERGNFMEVRAPRRTAIEKALFRLQQGGAKVEILGSFPKDAVWEANWQGGPQQKKKRDGMMAQMGGWFKQPWMGSAAAVGGTVMFAGGVIAALSWAFPGMIF